MNRYEIALGKKPPETTITVKVPIMHITGTSNRNGDLYIAQDELSPFIWWRNISRTLFWFRFNA